MNKVKFILGEDKHVKLLIRSPNDEPFTILSAHYSLLRYGEVEASGECEIDGHYLDVKISPQNNHAMCWKSHTWLVIRRERQG